MVIRLNGCFLQKFFCQIHVIGGAIGMFVETENIDTCLLGLSQLDITPDMCMEDLAAEFAFQLIADLSVHLLMVVVTSEDEAENIYLEAQLFFDLDDVYEVMHE